MSERLGTIAHMERFPRGSLPPYQFTAVATLAPTAVSKPPTVVSADDTEVAEVRPDPVKECDLSTVCPSCNTQMQPEHAHYRCPACGYRDSCCF